MDPNNLQEPQKVFKRLKLAKYHKGTETYFPANAVIFSDSAKKSGYNELFQPKVDLDLLELTPELEEAINNNETLEIRGADENDEVRLVTASNCFNVSRVGYSNTMLLSESTPMKENILDKSNCSDDSQNETEDTVNVVKVAGLANQYLEFKIAKPSVKDLFLFVPFYPEKIKFSQLSESLRASDKETLLLIEEFKFLNMKVEDECDIETDSYISRLTLDEEFEYLTRLRQTIDDESWNTDGFSLETIFTIFDEDLLPSNI